MRKKHPEHVNLERWLVSYADFITLLFAFFVIMYAMSQADMVKFKKFTDGIHKAFAGGPIGMVDVGGSSGGKTASPFEVLEAVGGKVLNMPAGKTNTAADPDPQLQEVREKLEEAVSLELGTADTSETLHMQFDSRGLIVRIATKDFFDEGSSEIRPDLRPILDRIGRIFTKTKRLIRVEGHTDPYEVSEAKGWELSAARAAWVAKYWIHRFDLDPTRIGVSGYSGYRPLAVGDEPWNRAKNRRVEFIILNSSYEVP